MHSTTPRAHTAPLVCLTQAERDRIISEMTDILRSPRVVTAEVWRDNEAPQERPGRLTLPRTQTVFVRVELALPDEAVASDAPD